MNSHRVFSAVAVFMCAVSAVEGGSNSASANATTEQQTMVELRQYTLYPGKRDVLIDIFERNFVEGQEEQGMSIIGQFRDLDCPDRFVWLRSFPDMQTRATSLTGFYDGPVWKAHRSAANATMVDSDNVLQLRPVNSASSFPNGSTPRPPRDAKGAGRGLVVASIVYLRPSAPGQFDQFFDGEVKPQWEKTGGTVVAELISDHRGNNFPRLPIREAENVFVWFSQYADAAAFDRHQKVLADSPEWRVLAGKFSLWTYQRIETLRLQPTARSQLQGR